MTTEPSARTRMARTTVPVKKVIQEMARRATVGIALFILYSVPEYQTHIFDHGISGEVDYSSGFVFFSTMFVKLFLVRGAIRKIDISLIDITYINTRIE